jgi:D-alanyl-D-alanine carboxypeptidase
MSRLTLAASLAGVAALTAGAVAPASALPTAPRGTAVAGLPGGTGPAVQATLDGIVRSGVPGTLTRVVDGGRSRSFTAGTVNRRTGAAIDPDVHFRIGSQTKTFTAVVVLQLVGEGRLSLSDFVEDWLPGLVPGGERITVRQLLQMQSGLANYTDSLKIVNTETAAGFRADRFRTVTDYDLIKVALGLPRTGSPGQGFHYSNTNYVLAGLIVEAVTGRPIAQEVTARVVQRLGLGSTSFPTTSPFVPGPLMNGYAAPTKDRPRRYLDATLQSPSWAGAAGAMISTTGDLSVFYQALLGGRLLRPAELAAMTSTVSTKGSAEFAGLPIRYGLGLYSFRTSCGTVWGHGGSIPGYQYFPFVSRDGRRQMLYAQNALPALGDEAAQFTAALSLPETVFCGGTALTR